MKISMRDYESIVNKIVNQIIFINALGDYEYHPEREDFLLDYFYLKYFTEYEFSVDYSFEEDIFSLEFYEDLAKEIESAMTEEIYRQKWNDIDFMRIKKVVADKVDFTKNYLLKKTSFSLTDTYLSELISKITEWLEDKGIEEFIKVVSETGEELGNKNYRELSRKLNKVVEENMAKLNTDSYVLVSTYVGKYYKEWKPNPNKNGYERTYQFLESVKKVDVTHIGNAYFSQVKIDYENISYLYDFGDGFVMPGDGYWAISAANEGNHGYETVGHTSDMHFWDDSLYIVQTEYIQKDFPKLIEKVQDANASIMEGG